VPAPPYDDTGTLQCASLLTAYSPSASGRILSTLFDDDPNETPTSGFAVAGDRVALSGVHGVYALPCAD